METPAKFQIEMNDRMMTISVDGVVRVSDVIRIVEAHYPAFHGPRILWNFGAADLSQIDPAEFAQVAMAVRRNTAPGVLRQTAYVMSGQTALLAAWRYLNEVTRLRVPVEYQAFTDVDEAMSWLNSR